jgi:TPR repeat protein
MLLNGEGGGKDPVQALAWMRLAASLGNEHAASSAKIIEKRLTPAEVARADAVFNTKGSK